MPAAPDAGPVRSPVNTFAFVLFPYSIPVVFPAPSCSLPVTNSLRSRENLQKANGNEVLSVWLSIAQDIFPVFFPVNGNSGRRRVRW